MARLNELPGPAESVEALKRRFVRQNREIARVNSLQSLRIQSLESELSHLLKENATLKEQVISLTHDAEKLAAGRAFHRDIYQCKEKLAAKVSELNSLVSELGMIPESFLKKTAHLGAADINIEHHRSSDSGRRPITWDENSDRLPTILEDKYFPRRTLDPEELAATQQDLDSPTIGSPPIAHFDVDQSPISLTKHADFGLSTIDATSPGAEYSMDSNNNKDSQYNPSDSPNNMNEDVPAPEQSPSPSKSVLLPALSGSKRKFSATEDEISFSPLPTATSSTLDDDFQFTRAVDVSRARRPNVTVEIIQEQPLGHGKKNQQKKANLAKRRVLEPKSTNMASSPKKVHGATVQQVDDGKPENKPRKRGEEENTRKAEPARKPSEFQPDLAKKAKRATTAATTVITHEDEAIRPISSSLDSMETEHERNKSFNASDIKDSAVVMESVPLPSLTSRPSRRARGAISYAEPNLRDKMRRATNELVDAVKLENAQRTSSSLPGNSGKDHEPESYGEYSPDQNDATSSLGTIIPHDKQGVVAELPKHLVTERKRRTLSASTSEIARLNKTDSESDLKQNAEANGIRGLLSPSSTNTTAQDHPRRRSASLNPQSRRHSSNPAVYDRGKSSQMDKLPNNETSELGSEYHDNDTILEEFQPQKTVTTKDAGLSSTARVRGTRTLVEDGNPQATRGQRASARRRSTLL